MSTSPGGDSNVGPVASTGEISESKLLWITVNGTRIQVTERVTVREIVTRASAAGAVSGLIEEYVIERVAKDGELRLDETITVIEFEEFMAVPVGVTPVAADSMDPADSLLPTHQRIRDELAALGYSAEVVEGETSGGPQKVVVFTYPVRNGRFRGKTFKMGISTQCEALGYPELPPHWLFISPPFTDTRDGGNHGLNSFAGEDWVALSRPPGPFWDKLPHKCMKAYMEHVSRVWKYI